MFLEPFDVPKLGTNIVYNPPEMLYDKMHSHNNFGPSDERRYQQQTTRPPAARTPATRPPAVRLPGTTYFDFKIHEEIIVNLIYKTLK